MRDEKVYLADLDIMRHAMEDTLPFVDEGSAIHLYLNRGGLEYSLETMKEMHCYVMRDDRERCI